MAIAASTTLTVVPDGLLHFLADYAPDPTVVLLRRGLKTDPGRFERLVAEWCFQFPHLNHRWVMPEPGGGSGAVFNRDAELVANADLVLAFFPDSGLEGGTGHVVERAIDLGVPVYSYTLSDETETGCERLGEVDPTDSWGPVLAEFLD